MPKLSHAVSIHPYFKIREGNLGAFTALMPAFIEKTSAEPGCLYYDFTRNGDLAFCREAYIGAEGLLAHVENVGELLGKFLELADLERLEVHGPESEIEKLREPLAAMKPDFFIRETGLENPLG
jgi:quinol monooxygenase YgiN